MNLQVYLFQPKLLVEMNLIAFFALGITHLFQRELLTHAHIIQILSFTPLPCSWFFLYTSVKFASLQSMVSAIHQHSHLSSHLHICIFIHSHNRASSRRQPLRHVRRHHNHASSFCGVQDLQHHRHFSLR